MGMSVAATVAKRIMPLFDRVLVQRAVAETKTKGGLLIPETAQKSPLEATVVAAGPGARNATTGETIPMSVAVGDRVLMPEWGSNKLEMTGRSSTSSGRPTSSPSSLTSPLISLFPTYL